MNNPPFSGQLPSSFRDPSGFLFQRDGSLLRQVNYLYKEHYDQLKSSGLYNELVSSGLLIPHNEVDIQHAASDQAYKVIRPDLIPFISYPYEWCFSQLKDAALTTIEIQKKAFEFGMSLKDCSAYNIQFRNARPIFIDTLSFEKYREGEPWIAYRQFCQHFLAPLALMSYRDIRLSQLLRIYIDGVPLDLVSSLLPFKTRLSFSLLSHIHLHARSQSRYADKPIGVRKKKMGKLGFRGLIDSLETTVRKLKWKTQFTEWADYYEDTNYSPGAFQHKKDLVAEFLDNVRPKTVWDLGGNIGVFSRIASDRGIQTICFDIDPGAVEKHYQDCSQDGEAPILPLVLDLTNPSPGTGWQNDERLSLQKRGPADMIFALALIHHLAISNNLPFERIAEFFSQICSYMIIEFVSKNDSQVQRLLASREDIFKDYNQQTFEAVFKNYFSIESSARIVDSDRTFYLMRRKGD
ncbi:MAG: SAM-dependent methyltransferase [Candidatus Latescibacteria bacterium]|nr:SAM-dependent methyltransferase [Candidatus Latescibacterota bacterium]NIM20896.1 SAM-dependent methyltransferase [Candidatus Latescibacterota bacterium]NIM65031.1 SAM-dependent methyltransferase [Candidatus Latescibacterota bacterium]NIO01546.1 SAM-dependent methyltransferase [Candidatus Latescibacterota bacterium]NIO28063.1 SAM-dependent methyltransferase [Candidatus Latescibacterota bacterium]